MLCQDCVQLGIIFKYCCNRLDCGCLGLPVKAIDCPNGCKINESLMNDYEKLTFRNVEYVKSEKK